MKLLILILLISCGKPNSTRNDRSRGTSQLKNYTPCRDSISGYCSKVVFQVYGMDPITFLCPVSNSYMSTGKEAVIKKSYNPWTRKYFWMCDTKINMKD